MVVVDLEGRLDLVGRVDMVGTPYCSCHYLVLVQRNVQRYTLNVFSRLLLMLMEGGNAALTMEMGWNVKRQIMLQHSAYPVVRVPILRMLYLNPFWPPANNDQYSACHAVLVQLGFN